MFVQDVKGGKEKRRKMKQIKLNISDKAVKEMDELLPKLGLVAYDQLLLSSLKLVHHLQSEKENGFKVLLRKGRSEKELVWGEDE